MSEKKHESIAKVDNDDNFKNKENVMKIVSLYIITMLLIFSIPSFVEAAPKKPDPGSDDCYNRATQTCNRKHPGKDWGDKVYRDCINDHLDWCDKNEPARDTGLRPVLNSQGRFDFVNDDSSINGIKTETINININLRSVK